MYWKGIAFIEEKIPVKKTNYIALNWWDVYLKETTVSFQSRTMGYPVDWHSSQGLGTASWWWLLLCAQERPADACHTAMLPLLAESATSPSCQDWVSSKVCFVTTMSGLLHPGWLVCLLWLPRESILETAL